MNTDLIHADTIVDRLPIHGAVEAVDDLITDTVPEIVAAGASSGRRVMKRVSKADMSRSDWLLILGTASGVLIALMLWRRRNRAKSAATTPQDATTNQQPRRVA